MKPLYFVKFSPRNRLKVIWSPLRVQAESVCGPLLPSIRKTSSQFCTLPLALAWQFAPVVRHLQSATQIVTWLTCAPVCTTQAFMLQVQASEWTHCFELTLNLNSVFQDSLSFNLVLNCALSPVQVLWSVGQSGPEALLFHQDYLRCLQRVFLIIPTQIATSLIDLAFSFRKFLWLLNAGKREEFLSSTR